MDTKPFPDDALLCPNCGQPMQRLPTLNGSGYMAVCPSCPSEPTPVEVDEPEKTETPQPKEPEGGPSPATRFRELLAQSKDIPSQGSWPENLLEDLPKEARELLSGQMPTTPTSSTQELKEDLARSLRSQGYIIEEGARGIRISGTLGAESGTMSPLDVVRMAADLEGGLLPPEKQLHCPKCNAVIPVGDSRCQWCGETIPPPEEVHDQD